MTTAHFLRGTVVAVLYVGLACGRTEPERARAVPRVDSTDKAPANAAEGSDLSGLLARLRIASGHFELSPQGNWVFRGDHDVLTAFIPFADSAVDSLVACLDDTTRARATAGGQRVAFGVMCYAALGRVASFEWGKEDEDSAGRWPGVIHPDDSPPDLLAAKRAWQDVLSARRYRLN